MKTVELFTVGRLHDPQPEEMLSPFRQLSLAEERARRRADIDEKDVIAIWNQNSEVIAVYTAGMKLEPVK
jgi:succinylarginine dihydrolase